MKSNLKSNIILYLAAILGTLAVNPCSDGRHQSEVSKITADKQGKDSQQGQGG